MKNEKKISGLPTEEDFGGSLDAKSAWKNFGGLDLNLAYERFCENPLSYQEDFMFMETTAFEFYFPVVDRFLRENHTENEFDDSVAWILGEAIFLQIQSAINSELLEKIESLTNYILNHLSQYSPLPVEQEEIESTWLKIQQHIAKLKNPNLTS
ncbi:MAG: hypothetical protein ABSE90_06165 [Verrucomicrobiota bacterium]|jgi:hypothetical protein